MLTLDLKFDTIRTSNYLNTYGIILFINNNIIYDHVKSHIYFPNICSLSIE